MFESTRLHPGYLLLSCVHPVHSFRSWPGLKGYLLKSFFSDSKNKFAIVWLFKTVEDRNRNFKADGSANELEKAAREKVKPIEEKLKKMYGN